MRPAATVGLGCGPRVSGNELRAEREETDVGTTAIRGTAAAVLVAAAVLGLAGCVNAEKAAPPGAGDSTSFGPPPTTASTTSAPATTGSAPANPSTGSSATQGSTTSDLHNQADVTFTKQAMLLRQQAVALAGAAGTASVNAQVKSLATEIGKDSVSTTTLTDLLSQWHVATPTPSSDQTTGVLTTSQLSAATKAQGTAFDMHWLQYMKANLKAAKQAVATEQANGSNAAAKQLAHQWAGLLAAEVTKINQIS